MESRSSRALGVVRESHLRPKHYVIGNLDLAALACVPGNASGYKSRSRYSFSARHQSIDRPRVCLHTASDRISRLAILRIRFLHREKSVVDRDARRGEISPANEFYDAARDAAK